MSGSIRLYGSTSGFVELQAPAVAADNTVNIGDIPQFSGVPSDGDLMRYDAGAGEWRLVGGGYVYAGQVRFTSDGTFSKANPLGTGDMGLRAIRVRMVGGGGGSGGCEATGASEVSAGGNGGGGGYAEKFITDIAGLASSESVVRGLGGTGGAAGNNAGAAGGTSSGFGMSATGGGGGGGGTSLALVIQVPGAIGAGGVASGGDINVIGGAAISQFFVSQVRAIMGAPGVSVFGGARSLSIIGANIPGQAAFSSSVGAGALGACCIESSSAQAGAAGSNGIVIVDCYV